MAESTINIFILTDINVSNVHRMIADILSHFEDKWKVTFLNVRQPRNFFDDSKWYDSVDNHIDVSQIFYYKKPLTKLRMLINYIKKADVVFCTGAIAGICFILRKPYIYFCTGSDLDQYAQYGCDIFEKISNISIKRKIVQPLKKLLYRTAIKKAQITIIAPYQFSDLKTLGYKNMAFFPHPLDLDFIDFNIINRSKYSEKIQQEFNVEWIFFSSTRQVWNTELSKENDYKGNDKVIRAFKYFLDKTHEARSKLFLIDKGADVDMSKDLIHQLELDDYVIWLQPMNRKRLIEFYAGAHVCFDQFSRGCLALCAIESMACGSPTISYIGEQNDLVPFYKDAPPVININDPEQIGIFMSKIIYDEEYRHELEVKSFQWVKNNCSYEKISDSFEEMTNQLLRRN